MKSQPPKKVKVHFEPDNIDIVVEEGENLLKAAIQAGVHITASCGGAGTCGTCKVLLQKGEVESKRTPKISDEEWQKGVRQACQSKILTDISVLIPVESRLETAVLSQEMKQVSAKGEVEALATGWSFNPPLSKLYVELPPPTPKDNLSDLSRLLRGIKQRYHLSNMSVEFEVLKKLPHVLRKKNFKVTATTLVKAVKTKQDKRRPTIINVEPGDTSNRHYSLAIDVGTTTVCGQLLDLGRGRVLASAVAYNAQISYGEDVITRIAYCQKPGGLRELQKAVVSTINEIIEEMVKKAGVRVKDIGHINVAGNTTMTQILLGLEPKYLRLSPYTPVANFIPPLKARDIGIKVGEHVHLFTFPSVASYVGGDIVSGVLGSGIYQRKKLTLFVDIGTNGEVVIGNSDWLVTASCSAGPAFEGGGIRHGMVASSGAIEGFSINPKTLEPEIRTIGEAKPKGICGSGLINIVAGLLEAGVISQNGKFNTSLASKRIREGSDGYEYVLCWADETQIGKDIVITEVDIENLIRAKAAMYAGYQTLAKSVGISCHDFEQIIIAGAFGSHIDIERSMVIGLFPEIPLEKFNFIGNGSLLGARLVSYSTDMLDDARRIATMMTNIELSENVDFMNNYVAALFLPHTDEREFPKISERLKKAKKELAV